VNLLVLIARQVPEVQLDQLDQQVLGPLVVLSVLVGQEVQPPLVVLALPSVLELQQDQVTLMVLLVQALQFHLLFLGFLLHHVVPVGLEALVLL
jgi:hypothetical protein